MEIYIVMQEDYVDETYDLLHSFKKEEDALNFAIIAKKQLDETFNNNHTYAIRVEKVRFE